MTASLAAVHDAVEFVGLLARAPECYTLNDTAREKAAALYSFLRDPRGWPEITAGASSPPHSPVDRYRCTSEDCPEPYSVWEFLPDDPDLDETAVGCPACGAEGELFFRWFRGGSRSDVCGCGTVAVVKTADGTLFCRPCYMAAITLRPAAATGENEMPRDDVVELLRELAERVDGGSETEITLGAGDDACVMDWYAFDGNFYRATIERIEP